MKAEMTEAQDAAIKKAWDILTEHFDRVLVVVDFELSECKADAHECWWHGGSLSSVGMAMFAQTTILNSKHRDNDPDEQK